jgi:hypothetical protein
MDEANDSSERTRQTVERYIELTRAWDNEAMLAMWADDGVLKLVPAALGEFHGKEEIAGHYRERPTERPFDFDVDHVHVDGETGIVEVRVHATEVTAELQVADVFKVDGQGRISSITGYHR